MVKFIPMESPGSLMTMLGKLDLTKITPVIIFSKPVSEYTALALNDYSIAFPDLFTNSYVCIYKEYSISELAGCCAWDASRRVVLEGAKVTLNISEGIIKGDGTELEIQHQQLTRLREKLSEIVSTRTDITLEQIQDSLDKRVSDVLSKDMLVELGIAGGPHVNSIG